MKPIRQRLQQALRALEFANVSNLADLEAMLESREAAAPPRPRGTKGNEDEPILVSFPIYRMPHVAVRH